MASIFTDTNDNSYEINITGDLTGEDYTSNGLTKSNVKTAILGTNVTSIGFDAFFDASSLTSVTIPDGVTSIGDNAFAAAYSLTSITFGENSLVNSIGINAFMGTRLTSIAIPDGVTSIEGDAFHFITSLTSIIVDTFNSHYTSVDGALFNKNKSILIQYPIGKTDTSYTIPDTVTSIGSLAFAEASSLTWRNC